jgi:hypothetical protein
MGRQVELVGKKRYARDERIINQLVEAIKLDDKLDPEAREEGIRRASNLRNLLIEWLEY